MRFGVTLPNAGLGGDPAVIAELAHEAEEAGWDGVFIWDSVQPGHEMAPNPNDPALAAVIDPWIAITAMAIATERVTIGPMITPVARRRPWKLAQECVSLDHLSGGRFVLSVGLGWVPDPGFSAVGEEVGIRQRAQRLDEGLAIVDGLWRGETLSFAGEHFHVDGLRLQPTPLHQPRVPVWVIGGWSSRRSLRRAAAWDGVIPQRINSIEPFEPQEITELIDVIHAERNHHGPFDVVIEGVTPEHDPAEGAAYTRRLEDAGATWYLESVWLYLYETPGSPQAIRRRIRQGPPR